MKFATPWLDVALPRFDTAAVFGKLDTAALLPKLDTAAVFGKLDTTVGSQRQVERCGGNVRRRFAEVVPQDVEMAASSSGSRAGSTASPPRSCWARGSSTNCCT
jgi:hypothetical protein